jgi:virginiamycin B lyase
VATAAPVASVSGIGRQHPDTVTRDPPRVRVECPARAAGTRRGTDRGEVRHELAQPLRPTCGHPHHGAAPMRQESAGGVVRAPRARRETWRDRSIECWGGAVKIMRIALLTAGLWMLVAGVAQAAPIGTLKQHRLPTADSQPRSIALGSDGNMWFTESSEFLPATIGRITPAGAVTEFAIECNFCILVDIVQGPEGVLYFTSNEDELGRITTAGAVLPAVPMPDTGALAGSLAAHGDDIWITDNHNNSVWRYDIPTGAFTQFALPTPGAGPADVAVDAAGIVWIAQAGANSIGRLDPATGAVTETPTTRTPRGIAVATDGSVWFTARFTPQGVGRLDPATGTVTEFPLTNVGPQSITAAPDGSVWFTQTTNGNIARATAAGVVAESKVVKGSEPFGITVDAGGDPWFAMMAANKVAELQLR